MKKCPFCAEEVQDEAIKCKHCNEWLKVISGSIRKLKVGGFLKNIRKQRRMTQQQMFELTGIQTAVLSRMENNKMIGPLDHYSSIARVLGLRLSNLFAELEGKGCL